MKPKKIKLFSLSLQKGGAETQLVKLAVALQNKTNYDISITYFIDSNDFQETLNQHKINYNFYNLKKIGGIINFVKSLFSDKPTLIVSFMFGANIIARFAKILTGAILITSVRNNEISNLYRKLYRLTYKLDDATTFNSKYAYEKFIKEKLANQKKSYLINNAIDIDVHKETFPKTGDMFTMVSIAHFRPQKDYRTLFKAIQLLKQEKHDVKLLVLGHLNEQTWPHELLKELDITSEVEIVGFTKNPSQYLDEADALVLSSLWEGTPNAILEAMAHKTPAIASNIPGNRELVIENNCGVLFEKENSENLKEQIIFMKNCSQDQRSRYGENGFAHILQHYESKAVHRIWENIINKLINEK